MLKIVEIITLLTFRSKELFTELLLVLYSFLKLITENI